MRGAPNGRDQLRPVRAPFRSWPLTFTDASASAISAKADAARRRSPEDGACRWSRPTTCVDTLAGIDPDTMRHGPATDGRKFGAIWCLC
jgi:hypothetical protein